MKCAFLVHLRTYDDIFHALSLPKFLLPLFRLVKPLVLRYFWKLSGKKGFCVKSKFRVNETTEGFIIFLWLTGEQLMDIRKSHRVRTRILDAVLHAQDVLGCQVIGLGALTSSVTDAGEWIPRQPGVTAAITHGDTYATVAAFQGIHKLCERMELDSSATIAIIGATGLIGSALSLMLSERKLLLIGRNLVKLEELKRSIGSSGPLITVTTDIEQVRFADVIVTATSWPGALIKPEHLKNGAVIYDISQPRNTSPALAKKRTDVVAVDGSFVSVPLGMEFWWMSLPPRITFACMAETMMQAMEGDLAHHVGEINPNFVEEVILRAKKHGFRPAPFTSFGKGIKEIGPVQAPVRVAE